MAQPEGLKFTKTHEWVRVEGEQATIGITQHAADELGDVALALLPPVGRVLTAGEPFGEIESLKAVSDLYAPLSGEVVAINDAIAQAPELVNADAFGAGWLLQLRVSDPAEINALLNADAYEALAGEG
jgi:glycine cleavage system H protein